MCVCVRVCVWWGGGGGCTCLREREGREGGRCVCVCECERVRGGGGGVRVCEGWWVSKPRTFTVLAGTHADAFTPASSIGTHSAVNAEVDAGVLGTRSACCNPWDMAKTCIYGSHKDKRKSYICFLFFYS